MAGQRDLIPENIASWQRQGNNFMWVSDHGPKYMLTATPSGFDVHFHPTLNARAQVIGSAGSARTAVKIAANHHKQTFHSDAGGRNGNMPQKAHWFGNAPTKLPQRASNGQRAIALVVPNDSEEALVAAGAGLAVAIAANQLTANSPPWLRLAASLAGGAIGWQGGTRVGRFVK